MRKWEKVSGIAFATLAALVGIWMVGGYFGLDKETWPAWVQAIGSIVAIAGAIEIGRRQVSAMREEAVESEKRLAQNRSVAINAIVEHAREEAESMRKMVTLGPNHLAMLSKVAGAYTFEDTSAALTAIPFHELGSYEAVSALLGMQASLKIVVMELAVARVGTLEFQASGGPEKLARACGLVKYHAGRYTRTLLPD